MVNINEINSIEDAKNAKYNNKELIQEEKTIFDNPLLHGKRFSLTGLTEAHNLDEIRKTALLLDDVKRAEKAELSDGLPTVNNLLNAMKEAKKNDSIAYQVVNSYNRLVDEAINRLEGLSRNVNLQGIRGRDNIVMEKDFEASSLKISAEGDADNIQGIDGRGDVRIKGFSLQGAEIRTTIRKVVRTEEEIQDEIDDKEEELGSKKKRLNIYEKEGNVEAMEKVENEIKQLRKEIRELKSELRQAQVQVN